MIVGFCFSEKMLSFAPRITEVAQSVEHWSPKPGVGSSSLSFRAFEELCHCITLFLISFYPISFPFSLSFYLHASITILERLSCFYSRTFRIVMAFSVFYPAVLGMRKGVSSNFVMMVFFYITDKQCFVVSFENSVG